MILEHGLRFCFVQRQPEPRVVGLLAPVGDERLRRLGDADRLCAQCTYREIAGHIQRRRRLQNEGLGRGQRRQRQGRRGGDGKQALGVAAHQPVGEGGRVGQSLGGDDQRIVDVEAALHHRLHVGRIERAVVEGHVVQHPDEAVGRGRGADDQIVVRVGGDRATDTHLSLEYPVHIERYLAVPQHSGHVRPLVGRHPAGGVVAAHAPESQRHAVSRQTEGKAVDAGRLGRSDDVLRGGHLRRAHPGGHGEFAAHAVGRAVGQAEGVAAAELGGVGVAAILPGVGAGVGRAHGAVEAAAIHESLRAGRLVEAQQQARRGELKHAAGYAEHVGIRGEVGIVAEGLFFEIVQPIVVCVGHQRIGRDPGGKRAAAGVDAVDHFPAGQLFLVGQAVAVAVFAQRVGL